MEVTREVVRDLIPAVAAGEASAASLAAVEEWSRRDPTVAAELAALRSALGTLAAVPRAVPGAGAEEDAVRKVRRSLRDRSALLAAAIFLTVLPLTFVWSGGRMSFLLIRDNPVLGAASLVAAAGCWAALVFRSPRAADRGGR